MLNRDGSLELFQKITAKRLAKRFSVDKEDHPHVICMAAPGTGKSRLADYGLEALKRSQDSTLSKMANDSNALAVHISFNGSTPFNEHDIVAGPEAATACRLLVSYFRNRHGHGIHLSDIIRLPGIRSLTIATSIKAILTHHLKLLQLPLTTDILLYVAIDDVSSICQPQYRRPEIISWSSIEDGKQYLKEIMNGFAAMYDNTSFFLAIIITGTVFGSVSSILVGSSRPFENLFVPLLSLEQSIQLTNGALLASKLPIFISHDMKLLLSDIGGIPRFIWQAIEGYIAQKSVYEIKSEISSAIKLRYDLPLFASSEEAKLAIRVALLRVLVDPLGRCGSTKSKWYELENQGYFFFMPGGPGNKRYVVLPLIHLEAILHYLLSPEISYNLIRKLCTNEWRSWEDFVLNYELVLMTLFQEQGIDNVPVGEYYNGALVGKNVANINLHIPSGQQISIVDCSNRYPEKVKMKLSENHIYKNCQGAKIDGFIQQINPNKTILLRCIHCKHTEAIDKTKFDYLSIKSKSDLNMAKIVEPRLNATTKLLHIFMSNRPLTNSKLPDESFADVVLVTRTQLHSFFGYSFGNRLMLMMLSETNSSESCNILGEAQANKNTFGTINRSFSSSPIIKLGSSNKFILFKVIANPIVVFFSRLTKFFK